MLRYHNNTAPPVTLDTGVDNVVTTLDVGDTTGYPPVPFAIAIERGTVNEEVCLVTAKSATDFTVTRGYDGTTAVSHGIGVEVEHVAIALDFREGYVPRVTETERDALSGNELWDGRLVFNTDAAHLEVALPGGGWDQILPVGAVVPFGGSVVPDGFLLADGSEVSRTTYAALYAIMGDTFGAGDGSTTFNLPDLRQRFPLGKAAAGTGSVLGSTGGAIDHTHTQTAHTHTVAAHIHSNPATGSAGAHTHTQGNTGSAGSHSHGTTSGFFYSSGGNDLTNAGSHQHSNPTTGSAGAHSHALADTNSGGGGSSGDGSTGGATDPTGSANPPFLVLNYLVRI